MKGKSETPRKAPSDYLHPQPHPSSKPGCGQSTPRPGSNQGPSRVTFARPWHLPREVPEALPGALQGTDDASRSRVPGTAASKHPAARCAPLVRQPGHPRRPQRAAAPPEPAAPRPAGSGAGQGCPRSASPPPSCARGSLPPAAAGLGPAAHPPPDAGRGPPRAASAASASAAGPAPGPLPPPRADWLAGVGGGAEWPGRFAGSGLQRRLAHRRERSRGARS